MVAGVAFLTASALSGTAGDAMGDSLEAEIAHGGTLYDDWFEAVGAASGKGARPAEGRWDTHPAYGSRGAMEGRDTWRCVACHGWDYEGADGADGAGIRGAAGKAVEAIVAVLKDATHAYSDAMMNADQFRDLALFVGRGQHDAGAHIDPVTGAAAGDPERGAGYYNTICAKCHGMDGRKPKSMADPLGRMARDDPWASLHKVRNGQPGAQMPALRALPMQVSVDVLAYTQTLPGPLSSPAR